MRYAFLLFMFCALLQNAMPQNASPTDYSVPVSSAQQARLGFNGAYSRESGETRSLDGQGSFSYNRFYSSLPFAWDISADALGSSIRTDNGGRRKEYNATSSVGFRKYFDNEGKFFYSLDTRANSFTGADRPGVSVTPGVGYGRFIRATELARAVRIEDFLLQENEITQRLPKETLIELAHVIERKNEFRSQHGDRYKVYWFEEMERIIAESGMSAEDGLSAAGILRIEEVLFQERVNERYYGWDIRAGASFEVLTTHRHLDRRDPAASLRLRYSRPIGWKSQVNFDGEINSPANSDFTDSYSATQTLGYLYELGNRVDFTLSNVLTLNRFAGGSTQTIEQVRGGFIFYLENRVSLNVTGQLSARKDELPSSGANVVLEYRL